MAASIETISTNPTLSPAEDFSPLPPVPPDLSTIAKIVHPVPWDSNTLIECGGELPRTNKCWKYDLTTRQYTSIAPMNSVRTVFGMQWLNNGLLLAAGGFTGGSQLA